MTKIDYVKNAEARIEQLEARSEGFNPNMTKKVIRQNARLFAQIQELEAENQRLNELLTIEKDVSEGALIANQLNFNVDKSVNESLNKLVNHVMKANQELKDENQKLKDANRHLARVNRMIPISEKKPTRKDFFLCQINDDHDGSAFRSRWFEGNKFDTDDVVVAWCELPEPYQETK